MELENSVSSFIKSKSLIIGKFAVVVAVSGGADSVALLHVLHKIKQTKAFEFNLCAAHLNHGLRGAESDEDAEFVKRLTKTLNIPAIIKSIDINALAEKVCLSVEETARIERYKFLEDCAHKFGAAYVAVAHSADDNAETVLHRIIRGTGLLGLGGIKPERAISPSSEIKLVRPFLSTWKKEILLYIEENRIGYREDSSNISKNYYRNKIRLELLPLLETDYNNQINRALLNLAEICNDNCEFVNEMSDSLCKSAVIEQNSDFAVFDNKVLSAAHEIVLQNLLQTIFTHLQIPLKQIGFKQYKSLIRFIKDEARSGEYDISAKLRVRKIGSSIRFQKLSEKVQNIAEKSSQLENLIEKFGIVELKVPGVTELPLLGKRIETCVEENKDGFLSKFKLSKTCNEEVIDMSKVQLPLYVRLRRPGDRFLPLGSKGTKTISDFFTDNKVPVCERDKIPIVTSKHHPVWVVCLRVDERVKVVEETNNLLILKYCS